MFDDIVWSFIVPGALIIGVIIPLIVLSIFTAIGFSLSGLRRLAVFILRSILGRLT